MAAGHREQVSVCARHEDKEACEEAGGGRVMSEFHSALSYLQTLTVSYVCEASLSALCGSVREHSPQLLALCAAAAPTNPRTGVHKQWIFCQYIGK